MKRTTSAPNLTASAARRTPLFERHVALGGRMVDFGGWELPQQYTSIRAEHLAVRKVAGLFDISHMGRFRVTGEAAFDFLQSLLTNDLSRISRGRAQYNLMCSQQGGILDDLVVYWGDEGFFVVVNAANREHDLAWMRDHAPDGVEIEDRTFELALIALQGPRAEELLPATGFADLPYFGLRAGQVAGLSALVSRTGYRRRWLRDFHCGGEGGERVGRDPGERRDCRNPPGRPRSARCHAPGGGAASLWQRYGCDGESLRGRPWLDGSPRQGRLHRP